ncbi:MAG TPA: citrate synthase [Acidimicrobiia bacterium]|nr:citrate synthase [Acidimicrobiia bacterium]
MTDQPSAQLTDTPVSISYEGETLEFPVVEGSEKERAVDISKLRSQTGLITLDYGYMNTGSTESAITFVDGDKGILRYRGYPIEQLAVRGSFLETSYLLIYGELPNKEALDKFRNNIRRHTMIHEDIKRFYDGFPKDAHPMAILSSVVSSLSTFYPDCQYIHDPEQVELAIIRLMAKLPTIAAYSYKKSIGQPFLYPDNTLDLIENFITMMFAVPSEKYVADPILVNALKVLLILQADHEQNCSTSTVRMVGSAEANVFASVAAGINALWGPLHGGANQQVVEMLESIRDNDGGDVSKAVARAKDPDNDFRLFGFGHRVYKNYDPRATIVKDIADDVLKALNKSDQLLDIALELEEVALSDQYFIDRKLYPNVDFYSGLIYRAMGFPTGMFTVLFAMGRLPGWIANWKEMMESDKTKLNRPRQVYTGEPLRDYVDMKDRV